MNRDAYGRFASETAPERNPRWSRFQTAAVTLTRSPYDAGAPTDPIAEAEERARFCVGPARRVIDSAKLRAAGYRPIVRLDTQYPGRRDG